MFFKTSILNLVNNGINKPFINFTVITFSTHLNSDKKVYKVYASILAMEITTIKLYKQTKSRLDKIRIHKKESYDDILQRILSILNLLKINPFQAGLKLDEINKIRLTQGLK